MFDLLFVQYILVRFELLSGHLSGNCCPLGWPYLLIVFCLFVFLFISHFDFKSGIWLMIAPVPVHCFSILFSSLKYSLIRYLWSQVSVN